MPAMASECLQRTWRTVIGLSMMALASCTASSEPKATLPNIIVILADDMGLGDLGCYNPESKVPTPHLDSLASAGMRFTDAHSPSSVCTPTRYGLLTGRYCWRTRIKSGVLFGHDTNLIDEARLTLPEMLRESGYETHGIGKWHLGLGSGEKTDWSKPLVPGPLEHGFDSYFGIPASLDMEPYVWVKDRGLEAAATEQVLGSRQARNGGGGFWRKGAVAPGFTHEGVLPRVTHEAVSFLQRRGEFERELSASDADVTAQPKPFFLYWALAAPHTPWLPSANFKGKSGAGVYGDFAAMVDDSVGQLMMALENEGLAENTIVIFTSDNGAHWTPEDIAKFGHRANADRRGQKADVWEGGHRVPFVVRWPKRLAPNSESDQLICLTDLMTTMARVVGRGLPADAAEDSVVIPQLADAATAPGLPPTFVGSGALAPASELTGRRDVVHHSLDGHFAIREGDWKLIEKLGSGGFSHPKTIQAADGEPTGQLYNLADDPMERSNLYAERPKKVVELQALLDVYRAQGHSKYGVMEMADE
jgi:arylsulfatase A